MKELHRVLRETAPLSETQQRALEARITAGDQLANCHGIEVNRNAVQISRLVLPLAWMKARQRQGFEVSRAWGGIQELVSVEP